MRSANVVYIAGAGRSGSTLLDMVLGSHPQLSGTGEVQRLNMNPAQRLCGCGQTVPECPFWSGVAHTFREQTGRDIDSWSDLHIGVRANKSPNRTLPNPLEALLLVNSRKGLEVMGQFDDFLGAHVRAMRQSWQLYDAICTHEASEYVIDSSKNAVRLKLLYLERPEALRVIHLVRDGRAVAASAMRRRDWSAKRAAEKWMRSNRNVMLMMAGMPSDHILRVHYEDFCRSPEATARQVCQFLNLDFDPDMLDFRATPNHQIPGNPILHDESNDTIRLDERWKRELSARDLSEFKRAGRGLAGLMNRHFGYR